jgi:Tfp pilus assembly protein PilN
MSTPTAAPARSRWRIPLPRTGGAPEQAPQVPADAERTDLVPRVDLMPPEITAARRLRTVQRGLAAGAVGVVALVGAGYAVSAQEAATARAELEAVQLRTAALQAEANQYAEAPAVLRQVEQAETAREQAMAADVLWYGYLNDLTLALPDGVWLTSLTATAAAPEPTAATGTNPFAGPRIGTVEVSARSLDHPDVATWLDALGAIDGVDNPAFSRAERVDIGASSEVVESTSTADLSQDALSNRYARKAG